MTREWIQLTRGVPPVEAFPVDRLRACADVALAEDGAVVLQYGKASGYPPLREMLACEVNTDAGRIIVGQGSLNLQDLCARTLLKPGDPVYVEEPTYDRTLALLRRAGALVVGFPVADDGVDVEAVEDRLKQGERPVFFYLIPDFQNPTGTVLSLPKREQLVRLAQKYGFWIVEDVPYRHLRYRGEELPTLFDLAPDRVIQIFSYSKLISPGLRVGYAVAPEVLVEDLVMAAEDSYINTSYLNQAIVYEFIRRGWLEPQLEYLKSLYRPRLEATLKALEEYLSGKASWHRPDGGFFVGVYLNGAGRAEELLRRAQEAGLRLTDGRCFFANSGGDGFVRIPFCSLTPEEIREGVARLASVAQRVAG